MKNAPPKRPRTALGEARLKLADAHQRNRDLMNRLHTLEKQHTGVADALRSLDTKHVDLRRANDALENTNRELRVQLGAVAGMDRPGPGHAKILEVQAENESLRRLVERYKPSKAGVRPRPWVEQQLEGGDLEAALGHSRDRDPRPVVLPGQTLQDLYQRKPGAGHVQVRGAGADALFNVGPHVAAIGQPVPMLLWCPQCGDRHIDEGDFATKEHHTHACQACGMVWRPAVVPTVGVAFLPGFKSTGPG
jgi:hypothetical protein